MGHDHFWKLTKSQEKEITLFGFVLDRTYIAEWNCECGQIKGKSGSGTIPEYPDF